MSFAATVSAACQAINTDWASGVYIEPDGIKEDFQNNYGERAQGTPFGEGERLTYVMDSAGSNGNIIFWIFDDNWGEGDIDIQRRNDDADIVESGTAPIPADADLYIGAEVNAYGYPGWLYFQVICDKVDSPAPQFGAIDPAVGPAAGGTEVTITGTDFTGAKAVTFGGAAATTFKVETDTQITATTPEGTVGPVDVVVTTVAGSDTLSNGFTYEAEAAVPVIAGIDPAVGPEAGGTVVTITGTDFTGLTGVSFGATAATSYTLDSATQISATTPAGTAGAVDVVVTTEAGSDTLSNGFTYEAEAAVPVIAGIDPAVGPEAGGTAVTITGTDFTGLAGVSFGGTAATSYTLDSATQISATTPAGTAGAVDVVVTTEAGSDTLSNGFTYEAEAAEPVISGIDPAVGPEAGGTAVTITGTDFTGLTGVSFGGTAATSYTLDSATQISATTPAGTAGAVDVVVTTEMGSDTLSNGFTYEAEAAVPVIAGIDPAVGPEAGGTAVTITGTDFTGLTGVSFGATAATSYTLDSATQISATTPAGTAGAVDVVVTTEAGLDTLSNGFTYEVAEPPASLVFSPAGGPLSDAMAGEAYSADISAAGGAGPLIYSLLLEGSLPQGMTLNLTTGDLSGPLDEAAEPGDYTFTIEVRDQEGATATATYTITVRERVVAVTDKVIEVSAGEPPHNVDLTAGATGGPFVAADILLVTPVHAGRFSIVNGEFAQTGPPDELGWYLKFVPNPAYSGPVSVQFRLTSALGGSNIGTVFYTLGYDAGAVAVDTDALLRDFVGQRQGLIASSLQLPGLLERRRMKDGGAPLSGGIAPSASGLRIELGTSLSQLQGDGATPSPLNVWIDSTFLALGDPSLADGVFGSFGMLGVGADYLLSDQALVGVTLQADWMTDPAASGATVTGNGWLAGPYASVALGDDVFWNASLLYGGSSNAVDSGLWRGRFDTRRWMANTSIEGQWHLGEATLLTPRLGIVYTSEQVQDYAIRNGAGDMIEIKGFLEDALRIDLGAEISQVFRLEDGSLLTPSLSVTVGADGLDRMAVFGSLAAGLDLRTPGLARFGGTLVLNGEPGRWSTGLRLGAGKAF